MPSIKSLTFILFIIIISQEIFAQQRPVRRPTAPTTESQYEAAGRKPQRFQDQLWYGGNIMLGYQGGTFSSLFTIGVAPMVGYKITPEFSIGPRVEFIYYNYRQQVSPSRVDVYNLFSGGLGPFARFKVFNMFFFHAEYQYELSQDINFNGDKITRNFNNLFGGIGYNPGGGEILLLYNFVQSNRNLWDSPFSLRFGFTINF